MGFGRDPRTLPFAETMPADLRATLPLPGLSPVAGKPIIARFDGGSLSSDGGLSALREVEDRLAACVDDPRAPERIRHSLSEMLRFCLLMIVAGYEDGNDADSLRHDPLFKLANGRLPDADALCSQPTLSRLENTLGPRALVRMARAMMALYCASFGQASSWSGSSWPCSRIGQLMVEKFLPRRVEGKKRAAPVFGAAPGKPRAGPPSVRSQWRTLSPA